MNCGGRIYVFLAVLQGEVDFAGGLTELPRSPRLAAWIKLVRLYLPIGKFRGVSESAEIEESMIRLSGLLFAWAFISPRKQTYEIIPGRFRLSRIHKHASRFVIEKEIFKNICHAFG